MKKGSGIREKLRGVGSSCGTVPTVGFDYGKGDETG